MAIPENDNQLWKGFNGHGLYSKRAERDVDGLVIDQTYAKKADVPALDTVLSDSSTTAITPKAVKDAIAAVDVIPELPQTPSSLYSETSGSMVWGGWETDEMDVPVSDIITIDGKDYQTVIIGNLRWMAQNLDSDVTGSVSSSDPAYGKLYSWSSISLITIPAGWRIPTEADAIKLCGENGSPSVDYRVSTWENGTNTNGFSAVPSGFIDNGRLYSHYNTFFTSKRDNLQYYVEISDSNDRNRARVVHGGSALKYKMSIRLCTDA